MRLSTQHQEHSQHWEKDQRKGSWPGCKVRPSTFLWGAPPGTLHNTDRSIYVGVSGPLRQHACALLKVASENYRSTQMKTAAVLLQRQGLQLQWEQDWAVTIETKPHSYVTCQLWPVAKPALSSEGLICDRHFFRPEVIYISKAGCVLSFPVLLLELQSNGDGQRLRNGREADVRQPTQHSLS